MYFIENESLIIPNIQSMGHGDSIKFNIVEEDYRSNLCDFNRSV